VYSQCRCRLRDGANAVIGYANRQYGVERTDVKQEGSQGRVL
jgi:hypothetical protein